MEEGKEKVWYMSKVQVLRHALRTSVTFYLDTKRHYRPLPVRVEDFALLGKVPT